MLPAFKYPPDPIATGCIEESDTVCECCGQSRGFIYAGSVYSVQAVESVCPWCIADGSVGRKYDATLSDAAPLASAGLPAAVIDEVTRRTPGYISWQQDSWLSCCGDACAFQGDAPREEIRSLNRAALKVLSSESGFPVDDLREMIEGYEPKGSPAFYQFVCLHCENVKYGGDFD